MSPIPLRVTVVLGTRPEAIKLAPVIQQLKQTSGFDTQVILTGQHREMVTQVMTLFNLTADHDLDIMQAQQTLTDITCRSLRGLEDLFQQLNPHLVLVQGDTTTAFAASLAAFYQQITLGHVEAGLRTNDLFNPYPEEANRRLISQLTQLHFAPTDQGVKNLKNSGVLGEIHHTGNTVIDALLSVAKQQPQLNIPELQNSPYRLILATVHRRENWGEPLEEIAEGFLKILNEFPDTALLLPLHRNPTVREPLTARLGNNPRVFLTEPLDYTELVAAIDRCYFVLTDSGGLQEEAPSLGKPVLVLRTTTERPEAVEAGTAKLVGTKAEDIFTEASILLTNKIAYQNMANAINPFGDGQASERIINIIKKYFEPVNS
ncbi:non-hydrolyzing UDP-N-acetylglucosamine 2-epimerase [Planktothrix paucivesiculata]|uniref:UDP-N-acetylglucosamine 2-epimerase (non-hydrolyzing) n=1 Tax=Planktothrix paucivesiculata PCC 9631 TaxID=671071 RepID=A0A7Z9DZI9_9CYAN|nr:UDP-N-acetylglucosamine 2-epimerase (non-hydrolyzing) [Planktothrix paucivesiculata]VXD17771.1 putative UDP-N-acetylglucosamine 2-epimerase [Planktothrix paucivesiculata PCC 9631]